MRTAARSLSALSLVAGAAIAAAGPAPTPAPTPAPIIIYTFDQQQDLVLRVQDIDGDGQTTGAGEVVRYFDTTVPVTGTGNSQGLLALGPDQLLATDNFDPDNVVLLQDLDGDGDAFGSAENYAWFDGRIPGFLTLTNPVDIKRGPGDAFYVLDNNSLDDTRPEAIYRLIDLNEDAIIDIETPGEVTLFRELSPIGMSFGATTFALQFDNTGYCYVYDISMENERIRRIAPDGLSENVLLTSSQLFAGTGSVLFFSGSLKLSHIPDTDEILIPATDLGSRTHLIALKDRNGSGMIDALSEYRVLWTSALNADGVIGFLRDFVYIPEDGSVVFVDSGRDNIVRLFDLNGDGDYMDAGETTIIYNKTTAAAAGQIAVDLMLSVAVAIAPVTKNPCPADLDGDGAVGATDLATLLGSWGQTAPDLDGDEVVGASDLAILLGSWGACP